MRFRLAVMAVALLAVSCGDDVSTVASDGGGAGDEAEETGVEGVWAVVEVDGQPAEVGVNMARAAYLDIAGGEVRGHLGCNSGGGMISISETTIQIDEFFREAAGCIPEDLEIVEEALWAAIVADPATYSITASQMIWLAGGHEVLFERVGAPPTTTRAPAPRRHSVMGLDCGNGWVEEITALPNTGQPVMEVAVEYEPTVVEVEETGPLMNVGRNADGTAVILIYLHDTAEMDFQIWYCVD